MPHVAFVPLTGFRVREQEMLELGMTLPGLRARSAALAELPALGLLTLAGMLPEHWTCSYHGSARWDEDLLQCIVSERPSLVAISALTASVEEAYRLSVRLRQENIATVMGGLHVTVCPGEAQTYCTSVIVGEGEPVWPQVLADAEAGRLRREYRLGRNSAYGTWPLPRFDLLGLKPRRFTLQTQRGCPLACDFCGSSRLLGGFREKPLENVRRELAAIRLLDPEPLLELADDNTFAGPRDSEALLAALQESNARWFTEADWRIGERPELVARLAAAGCVQILVGIESLVFRYPGMGEKRAELQRIMDAVSAIQNAGVAVNGCFIAGADGETPASLKRLVRFVLDSPLADVQMTLQTPFPGTALHRRLKRQGRLLEDRSWSHYTLFDVTFQPDSMSVTELERGFRDVLREVFSQAAAQARDATRRNIWRRNARLNP